MITKINKRIKELITSIVRRGEAELEKTEETYPEFRSPHEAYAVIKERIEKTRNELDTAKVFLWEFWNGIKKNNTDEASAQLASLYEHAFHCAVEAIVLTAMVKKTNNKEGEE